MGRLNLKASDSNDRVVLEYLEANVSEMLAERINAGTKTLKQCWNFIISEAKKQATNGCACIDDKTVFGWAIHFFEEDDIKGEDFNKSSDSVAVKSGEKKTEDPKPKPEKTKSEKPKPKIEIEGAEQIGFDFGG